VRSGGQHVTTATSSTATISSTASSTPGQTTATTTTTTQETCNFSFVDATNNDSPSSFTASSSSESSNTQQEQQQSAGLKTQFLWLTGILTLLFGGSSAPSDPGDQYDWGLISAMVFQGLFFWTVVRHGFSIRKLLKAIWAWVWIGNWHILRWGRGSGKGKSKGDGKGASKSWFGVTKSTIARGPGFKRL